MTFNLSITYFRQIRLFYMTLMERVESLPDLILLNKYILVSLPLVLTVPIIVRLLLYCSLGIIHLWLTSAQTLPGQF